MRTDCINNTNFQGQIIRTGNNFSAKPQQCLSNAETQINDLIKTKPFDLYIHQDFSKNEIVFETDLVEVKKAIPITAKASKYIEAAKNTIEEHEKIELAAKEDEWEKEQNKAEKKEILSSILFIFALPFMLIAHDIKEGMKDLKITFNKLAKKFATKKG